MRWSGGFYAIFDPDVCPAGLRPEDAIDALLSGGAVVLQLRGKGLSDRELLGLARRIQPRCAAAGVPFVVNDRLDIALLCGADGVHLGQDDVSIADARRLAPDLVIGLSTHSADQAQSAVQAGADLIGFGPVFDTSTKQNPDATVGLTALREVCASSAVPVVAIGGLDAKRAQQAYAAGAHFACAISAALRQQDAPSIQRAARTLTPLHSSS